MEPVLIPEAEYDAMIASGKLNFGTNTLLVAKLVLVQGMSLVEAGKLAGVSKQAAFKAVNRVLKCIEEAPPGWVKITRWVPPELALEIDQRLSLIKR